MYDVVKYRWNEPAGKNNVLKPEWLSIFPSVHTVTIWTTAYFHYNFSLEALLESMKAFPPSIGTVIVRDSGKWAERALTDDISGLFAESGWTAEYKDEELVLNQKSCDFLLFRGRYQ